MLVTSRRTVGPMLRQIALLLLILAMPFRVLADDDADRPSPGGDLDAPAAIDCSGHDGRDAVGDGNGEDGQDGGNCGNGEDRSRP